MTTPSDAPDWRKMSRQELDRGLNNSEAVAGSAALQALAAAQQVCGAMGFTAEFGLHRLVRRGYLLDALLGGSEAAPARIAGLLAAEGLPRLVAL